MPKKRINVVISPKAHEKAKRDSLIMFDEKNVSKLIEDLILRNNPLIQTK